MSPLPLFFQYSELDQTTFPEFREQIAQWNQTDFPNNPRTYPGYKYYPLKHIAAKKLSTLEQTLVKRRSIRTLGTELPSPAIISRILRLAHGIHASEHRGAVPSSGGLQSLELYLTVFETTWIEAGLYHYDRVYHQLSQITPIANRLEWHQYIPSLDSITGGSVLWILVGDGMRIEKKYGGRGYRFLFLEAGHLMQNLCLLSTNLGLCTVPLGGFFEQAIANQLLLLPTDVVLYTGICGTILR